MRRMREELLDAFGFLTILPVPSRTGGPPGGGARAFPLVGLVIGLVPFAALCLPLPGPARAALALALQVLVTGGLHEDAWADVADGAFAVATPDRRLEILEDPRIGAHGLTATVLLLLLRWAAFLSVRPAAALAAPVVGRWAMVAAATAFPPARSSGLGARFAATVRPVGAVVGTAVVAAVVAAASLGLIAFLEAPGRIAVAWAAGAVAAWLTGRFLAARFGGLNGDGYGAVGMVAELAALWTFLPWTG